MYVNNTGIYRYKSAMKPAGSSPLSSSWRKMTACFSRNGVVIGPRQNCFPGPPGSRRLCIHAYVSLAGCNLLNNLSIASHYTSQTRQRWAPHQRLKRYSPTAVAECKENLPPSFWQYRYHLRTAYRETAISFSSSVGVENGTIFSLPFE